MRTTKDIKTIEELKLEWQKHNRDNWLSWNEVATLVDEVAQLYSSGDTIHCDACGYSYDNLLNDCPTCKLHELLNSSGEEVYVECKRTDPGAISVTFWEGEHPLLNEIHLKKLTRPAVTDDAKGRYEKALSYYENETYMNGETFNAVKQALLLASGYLFDGQSTE